MSGGNTAIRYPLGLWSQISFRITMTSTLHKSQGIWNSNIQNIPKTYRTTQSINM